MIIMGGIAPAHAITKAQQPVVAQAQAHLNSIRSLKARFTQIAPSGQISSGTLYIKRAGKMRWEYDPPVPVIMVTRGTYLRYYDHELEQISDIPLVGSIAGLIAEDTINFADKDLKVLEARAEDTVQVVRVTSASAPEDGEISFIFTEKPYALKNILTKDAKGEETTIALQDAEINIPLKDDLFAIYDPNIRKRQRKK
jgi:outer membrane lipoprotein-sorting protein